MRIPVVLLVVGLSSVPAHAAPPSADAPAAELLERLAAHAARIEATRKGHVVTITTHSLELDDDGRPKRTSDVVARVAPAPGGGTRTLVRYVEDGKDLTAEKKREFEGKKASGKRDFQVPFAKEQQPRYRFSLAAGDAAHPGLTRIAFAPAGEPSDELLEGSAWVDAAAGELSALDAHLSKNPTFVDRMDFVVEFHAPGPEGPVLSRLKLGGVAGLPLMKKRFEVDSRFSEWTRP